MRKIPQKFLNVGVRLFSGSLEATLSARYVNDVMIFPIVNDVIMFPFKTIRPRVGVLALLIPPSH